MQDIRRSDVGTTELQDLQASSISDVQKRLDRNRQAVSLEPDLDSWTRERKHLGHRVEISDSGNEAARK